MGELTRHVEELIRLQLWDSAETLVKWLLSDRSHSPSHRAAHEELLGDILCGKVNAGAAQQHYKDAVRHYKIAAAIEGSHLLEARKAKATLKLARSMAGSSPKQTIALLEEIPLAHRDAPMLALLGQLYAKRKFNDAAIVAYKACLEKCPWALEAALAMADLGAPAGEISPLLHWPDTQMGARTLPGDAALNTTGGHPEKEATVSVPMASGQVKDADPLPARPVSAGEKRSGGAQQSPERKRMALDDRAALKAADINSLAINSAGTCPTPLRMTDENGKQGTAVVSAQVALGREGVPHVPPDPSNCSPSQGSSWPHLLVQGAVHEQQRNWPGAVQCYATLASQCPDNVDVLLRLANARAAVGDSSSAVELYKRCRRLEKGLRKGMDAFAMLLYHEGRLQELSQLSNSLGGTDSQTAKPGSPGRALPGSGSWVAAAAYLISSGAALEAAKVIEQAAQVGVHHWALQFLKGELLTHNWERLGLSQQEGLDAAILAYSQSHKLRPSWHAKFGCAIATTDQNQALRFTLEAAEGREPEALAELAVAYPKERSRDAHKCADEALAKAPHNYQVIGAKASLLFNEGRLDEALLLLTAKLEDCPHASLHVHVSRVLRRLGRPREAVVHLQTALGMDPSLQAAKNELAECQDSAEYSTDLELRGDMREQQHIQYAEQPEPPQSPQEYLSSPPDTPVSQGFKREEEQGLTLEMERQTSARRQETPLPESRGFEMDIAAMMYTRSPTPAARGDTPGPSRGGSVHSPEPPSAPRRGEGSRGERGRSSEAPGDASFAMMMTQRQPDFLFPGSSRGSLPFNPF